MSTHPGTPGTNDGCERTGPPAGRSVYGIDPDAVARAALACDSVMGLGDDVASYLDGRRVAGVSVHAHLVRLHVISRYDVSVDAICAEISAVVMPLAPGKRLDVVVVEMVELYPFDDAARPPV